MSKVFRYITIEKDENNKPTEIKIKEFFLGLTKIDDQTVDGVIQEIIDNIKSVGLDLLKCRGQGYDGAAVMCLFWCAKTNHCQTRKCAVCSLLFTVCP